MSGSSTQGVKTVLHPVSGYVGFETAGQHTVTDPDGNVLGLIQGR